MQEAGEIWLSSEPDRYYHAIGQVTVASSAIEDLATHILLFLADDPKKAHVQLVRSSSKQIFDELQKQIPIGFGGSHAPALMECVVEADRLRTERNDIVHGVWIQWAQADTGEYAHFQRFRYTAKRGDLQTKWDVTTPTLEDLASLTQRYRDCHRRLEAAFQDAMRSDESLNGG